VYPGSVQIRSWPTALNRWPTVQHCLTLFANLRQRPTYADYDAALDRIVNEHFTNASVPKVLYHYTSIAAFDGIVTSRLIWAFLHRDMHDKNELRSIDGVIDQAVYDLGRETTGPARFILAMFAENHPGRRIADQVKVGLRCFTAESDSPPHWDKFTSAGQGVCIAFRTIDGETPPAVFDAHIGMSVYPVEYDRSVWQLRLKRGLAAVLSAFNAYAVAGREAPHPAVAKRTVVALAQIAGLASIAAKNWDLRDEKEWRHVIFPELEASVQWQTTETGRHYLALPARADGKLLLLDRVIVRSATPDADVKKVMEILRTAGYPSADAPMPEVTVSTYPLKPKAA
jgi:hypothetical protein